MQEPPVANACSSPIDSEYEERSAQWKLCECSKECKPLTEFEVDAILCFREAFPHSAEKARQALAECYLGCPIGYYTKVLGSQAVELKGHPFYVHWSLLHQYTLRILRVASTHFLVLRKFVKDVTSALSTHRIVYGIDSALHSGNHQDLMKISEVESLFSCYVDENFTPVACDLALGKPTLEVELPSFMQH